MLVEGDADRRRGRRSTRTPSSTTTSGSGSPSPGTDSRDHHLRRDARRLLRERARAASPSAYGEHRRPRRTTAARRTTPSACSTRARTSTTTRAPAAPRRTPCARLPELPRRRWRRTRRRGRAGSPCSRRTRTAPARWTRVRTWVARAHAGQGALATRWPAWQAWTTPRAERRERARGGRSPRSRRSCSAWGRSTETGAASGADPRQRRAGPVEHRVGARHGVRRPWRSCAAATTPRRRRAIAFQMGAHRRAAYQSYVGAPYQISVVRYYGDGSEWSDSNADGPEHRVRRLRALPLGARRVREGERATRRRSRVVADA